MYTAITITPFMPFKYVFDLLFYFLIFIGLAKKFQLIIIKKNLFAAGQSLGGGFALILGALCPGVTGVAADVPALCDHDGKLAGHNPGWPQLLIRYPKFAEDANYYDAANFAAFIKCPVLMSAGLIDTMCPPASIYSAYNRIKGEKAIYTDPLTGHGTGRKRRMFQMMPLNSFHREQIRKNNTK